MAARAALLARLEEHNNADDQEYEEDEGYNTANDIGDWDNPNSLFDLN